MLMVVERPSHKFKNGRSTKWNIDRIIFRHSSISDATAQNISNPESPRAP